MDTNLKAVGDVSALCIYPVKSAYMYVLNVLTAQCTDVGLYIPKLDVYDRQYAVLMPNGKAASMREHSRLTLIRPSVQNGIFCIDAPDLPTLKLPKNLDELNEHVRKMDVLDQYSEGTDGGDEAGEWLSKHLGKPGVRLLCFSGAKSKRTLYHAEPIFKHFDIDKPQENPKLSFPDFAPYTMVSEESVADLNIRMQNPVSIMNFRQNIVIKGCEPYQEDTLNKVKIGSAEFRIFSKDPRCSLITIDPETASRHTRFEPLYRPVQEVKGVKWPFLGVYMVLTKPGDIKVGDTLSDHCIVKKK